MRTCPPFTVLLFITITSLAAGCGAASNTTGFAQGIDLLADRSLRSWRFETAEGDTPIAPTWRVDDDGVLVCTGQPIGALLTRTHFRNYVLTLEWRWKPGGEGGNAGVLVHATTPGAIGPWPKSLEVQLEHRHAGDYWIIGRPDRTDRPGSQTRSQDREDGRGPRKPAGRMEPA